MRRVFLLSRPAEFPELPRQFFGSLRRGTGKYRSSIRLELPWISGFLPVFSEQSIHFYILAS
jgi:hypothetical protein